uniref:protein RCC2 n=1 Tax=Lonchura striata TaxID=40157 RepID=UPI0012932418
SIPKGAASFDVHATPAVTVHMIHSPTTKPTLDSRWPLDPDIEVAVTIDVTSRTVDDNQVSIKQGSDSNEAFLEGLRALLRKANCKLTVCAEQDTRSDRWIQGGSSGGSSEEEAPRERRPRDGSPGARRPGRPGAAAAAPGGPRGQSVVICEPEHSKERIKLEGSKSRGQLLIFGATNWDLIGRKEVPKQQAAYRNLGQNLWGPHRYGSLGALRVRSVVSGPCAAHSLLITAEGRLWSWGRNEKGQLGHGDTKRVEAPRPIEALGGEAIVAAACGRNHTLALTGAGAVFPFSRFFWSPFPGFPDPIPGFSQILYNGQPISKLGCGAEFSMVMDCKGNLYSFGCPEYGQLGHNSDGKFIARAQRIEYDCELLPRRVALFVERTKDGQVLPVPNVVVRDVACGANHTSVIVAADESTISWGPSPTFGELGYGDHKPKSQNDQSHGIPELPWLPARDHSGNLIPAWDPP